MFGMVLSPPDTKMNFAINPGIPVIEVCEFNTLNMLTKQRYFVSIFSNLVHHPPVPQKPLNG
jgi:hypothetical protein